MELAILIVTLERRRQFFARLMRRLQPQLSSRVNVYALEDAGAEKIGEKRQRMIESVKEPYLCFVDDDDDVAPDYCSSISKALKKKPDVVGFRLRYFEDGDLKGKSLHSVKAKEWKTEKDGWMDMHYRTPNHLNPLRTDLALEIGFKPLQTGEDSDFSIRLFAAHPDMKEVFVDKYLYSYHYRTPQIRAESEHLPVPDFV